MCLDSEGRYNGWVQFDFNGITSCKDSDGDSL